MSGITAARTPGFFYQTAHKPSRHKYNFWVPPIKKLNLHEKRSLQLILTLVYTVSISLCTQSADANAGTASVDVNQCLKPTCDLAYLVVKVDSQQHKRNNQGFSAPPAWNGTYLPQKKFDIPKVPILSNILGGDCTKKTYKRTRKKRWRQVVKCCVMSFFRPEARPINKSYDRVGKEGKGESEGRRGKKEKKRKKYRKTRSKNWQ